MYYFENGQCEHNQMIKLPASISRDLISYKAELCDNIIVINGRKFESHCFAVLFREMRESNYRYKKGTKIYYILGQPSALNEIEVYSTNILIRKLNIYFGKYMKISTLLSGKKVVKIVSINIIKNFPHAYIGWGCLYLLSVMIRLMDTVYTKRWYSEVGNSPNHAVTNSLPIINWYDLIVLFYQHVSYSSDKYHPNDNLAHFARSKNTLELKKYTKKWLEVIQEMFGQDSHFNFTVAMISNISRWQLHGVYQTPVWNYFNSLLGESKK